MRLRNRLHISSTTHQFLFWVFFPRKDIFTRRKTKNNKRQKKERERERERKEGTGDWGQVTEKKK